MLDSLIIKNFRCLEDFSVEKLGRVNLIVGKNNSGKSTVLEALRLYAGNAQRPVLDAISQEHDEKIRLTDADRNDPDALLPYQELFSGRRFPSDDSTAIEIGSIRAIDDRLRIQPAYMETLSEVFADDIKGQTNTRISRRLVPKSEVLAAAGEISQVLYISKGSKQLPIVFLSQNFVGSQYATSESTGGMPCSTVSTQFSSSDDLADGWDKIVFTKHEQVVKEALQIILPDFDNLTFVRTAGEKSATGKASIQRGAKVQLKDVPRPVPLNSLGDGMLRVLQLALKIFPAKGGFLLIDEFENGLHYSVQARVWEVLFEMALRLDIQVFATTHSWDCIESFAKVAHARKDVDGVLFRVGKSVRTSDRGRVIATVFDEAALFNITQNDAEVR